MSNWSFGRWVGACILVIVLLLGVVFCVIFWPLTRLKVVSDVSGYEAKLNYSLILADFLEKRNKK